MDTPHAEPKAISLLSDHSPAAAAARSGPSHERAKPPFRNGGPKLTLSSHNRPEAAVRFTDAPQTRLILTKYELLDPSRCRTLGHGASSTVRLAYRRSDGRPVAVKTIAKHDALGLWSKTNRWRLGARDNLSSPRDAAGEMRRQVKASPRLDEVDVLTSLKGICPNVVQLLDVYETHQEVQLVLEYCEGGDLFDCIKTRKQLEEHHASDVDGPLIHGSFTEGETAMVAKTMLDVLNTLHSRHIVHRDIKPENILLVDADEGMDHLGTVKLSDFGLARQLHDDSEGSDNDDEISVKQRSRAYSRVGSDYYAAPEVQMGSGYDTPVDIYSLGVTLYVMLVGTPPSSTSFFKSEDGDFSDEEASCVASVSEESSQASSCSMPELFPAELHISSLAQDLVSKMIHPNPDKRIAASEALKHEWIVKNALQAETQKVTHDTFKLSLSSSSDSMRPRALSFAESESLHRIGPSLPVGVPSNTPSLKMAKRGSITISANCRTPPLQTPNPNLEAAISLTLADVCSKLAPLVDEQRLRKQRSSRHHSLCHGDKVHFHAARKHSRISGGSGDRQPKTKRKKKVCIEVSSNLLSSPSSCGSSRIGQRFNSPIPAFGPILPKQSKSPA